MEEWEKKRCCKWNCPSNEIAALGITHAHAHVRYGLCFLHSFVGLLFVPFFVALSSKFPVNRSAFPIFQWKWREREKQICTNSIGTQTVHRDVLLIKLQIKKNDFKYLMIQNKTKTNFRDQINGIMKIYDMKVLQMKNETNLWEVEMVNFFDFLSPTIFV